jgi:hypothetical protein
MVRNARSPPARVRRAATIGIMDTRSPFTGVVTLLAASHFLLPSALPRSALRTVSLSPMLFGYLLVHNLSFSVFCTRRAGDRYSNFNPQMLLDKASSEAGKAFEGFHY